MARVKIFVREPMGVIGTVGIPILMFAISARFVGPHLNDPNMPRFMSSDLPVFAATLTAISAVLSLIAIIAIYRDGGILKRLRATPLRPLTILAAQVVVKLLFTALTLVVMIAAGRRYYPVGANVPLASFTVALLVATAAITSMGFVIASLVPTARFAQPSARCSCTRCSDSRGCSCPSRRCRRRCARSRASCR
jgi:ABC-2 type transport system permease protein